MLIMSTARPGPGHVIPGIIILAFILLVSSPPTASAREGLGTLKIGVRASSLNRSWLETKLSEPPPMAGVNHHLLITLKDLLGVDFQYVVCSTMAGRRKLLRQGNIDLIALDSPQLTTDPEFDFMPLGLAITRRLFVHKSQRHVLSLLDLSGKKVAVLAGDNYESFLDSIPGRILRVMDNPRQALMALNEGEVEAFLAPSARTAESIIISEELYSIVKVGRAIERIEMCLTFRRDNHELKAALKTAVAKMGGSGKLKLLQEKWYDVHYSPSPYKRVFPGVALSVALILLATLFVVFMNRRLKSRVKQVTKDLRDSEERYRGLIQSAPDMVIVLDRERMIAQCNPIATQFLGLNGERGAWRRLSDYAAPGQKDSLNQFIDQTFSQGSAHREFKLLDSNGDLHEVDVAASLIPACNELGAHICCFARDVTQRNTIERELVKTDRLSTIGKMAAGVAHEINNPLGIVRANAELMLTRKMYTSESKEFLEAIKRNSIRAGRTTQELLAVARPKTPVMRRVNLEEQVILALAMLGAQLKNIELKREPAEKPPLVKGDLNLLQQVLVNLLLNAKAAMKGSEKPQLLIRICPDSDEKTVRLRIEDNGRGIKRKHLREIFEPFFSSDKKEGFGLGLFISQRIIEKHGGIIFAESEPGKGSYFIVELPADNPNDIGLCDGDL